MTCFSRSKQLMPRVYMIVLACCLTVFVLPAAGLGAPASTQEGIKLTTEEKQALVKQAVADYEQGAHEKARQDLELAQVVFPENYAVPYYLGLIYLEQGQRSAAIAQWQRYVKMDPYSENALKIRKNITLLLKEQAREFASQAVAAEAALAGGLADDQTVAVTNFTNLGSEQYGPLGKGMAAMLISDLSQVSDLKVVDRIKLQALLYEMQLGASGLVDAATAPRVGKLLKARHVTSGSLADLQEQTMMIASAVIDADQMGSVGTQEAQGELARFYDLEKQIACQIVEDLGKDCAAMPPGFTRIHTKSMPALVFYSKGLDYFDQENYDQAREMFQKALEEDPQFDLAEDALLATPTTAMLLMGSSQMASAAAATAPPSAVAGTAVVGTTVAGTTTAAGTGAAVASGTVGFSPTTALIAGAVVVGGGVALAAGGGGGDPPLPPPQPPNPLTGDWRGSWIADQGFSGEATLSLTQSESSVNGTISIPGNWCLNQGNISGYMSGNSVDLTVRSDLETIKMTATYDSATKTLNGNWNYPSSASGCEGNTGTFGTSLKTGNTEVRW